MPAKPPPRRPAPRPSPVEEPPPDDLDLGGDPSAAESGATMVMSIPPPDEEPQGSADATMVFNTNNMQRPSAGPPAKLVVTRGPKAGSEFTLGPGESSIGRQNDNTIVIPDISVSRKHVVLRKEGAGYKLVDQGSGNGTLLNGERVQGEADLNNGDVFVIGDTEIRFDMPQAAARPAPRAAPPRPAPRPGPSAGPGGRPAPRRPQPAGFDDEVQEATGVMPAMAVNRKKGGGGNKKPLIFGAIGLVVVLGGLAMVKSNQANQQRIQQQAALEAQAGEVQQQYNDLFESAKKKILAKDFKGAIEDLTKAQPLLEKLSGELGQDVSNDDTQLKLKLAFAQKEVSSKETFDKASELLKNGELSKAHELLKGISEESIVHDDAAAADATIKTKIPERLVVAKGLLASKDYEKAREIVTDVLAVDPTNADAADVNKQLDAANAPKVRVVRKDKDEQKEDPTEKILAMYRSGKLDESIGAASACDEGACKALLPKLTEFKKAYGDLDNESDKAQALLKELSGGSKTPYDAAILGKGTTKFVKDGLKAMSAEKYCDAFAAFYKVVQVDASNGVADKNLKSIRTKAKDLFDQAYVDKTQDPEKATKEFQQVMCMTAADDELHQKATRHLKSLGN